MISVVILGHLEMLKVLLGHLLLDNSEDKNPVLEENEEDGDITVLHMAASHGQKNILAWYKDDLRFHDINLRNNKGITPLKLAAKQQELEIVKFYTSNLNGFDADSKFSTVPLCPNINDFWRTPCFCFWVHSRLFLKMVFSQIFIFLEWPNDIIWQFWD